MAWNFTPGTYSSGATPATWTSGTKPSAADFKAIASDIHTWGGSVDAASNSLYNLSSLIATDISSISAEVGCLTVGATLIAATASSMGLSMESGAGRIIAFGPDASTYGTFNLMSAISTGGSQRIWLQGDPSGRVGIGTAPLYSLDIQAPAGGSQGLALRAGGNTSGDAPAFDLVSFAGTVNLRQFSDSSAATSRIKSRGVLCLHAGDTGFTSTNQYMTIGTDGKVAIGVNAGSAKLHVYGAAGTGAPTLGDGAAYLQDSGGSSFNGGALVFGASQGFFAGVKGQISSGSGNTTGDLVFFTRINTSDANLTQQMRISSAGIVTLYNLPTSSAGLTTGQVWRNGTVLNIV